MTYLKRCVWAVAIGTLAASGAFAQTTGGTGGGGLGGGGGGLGGGATNNIAAQAAATAQAPTIGSTAAGFSNPVTQPSNILTPFYANPTYAGAQRASGTTVVGPGGFGQPTVAGGGTAAAGTGGRVERGVFHPQVHRALLHMPAPGAHLRHSQRHTGRSAGDQRDVHHLAPMAQAHGPGERAGQGDGRALRAQIIDQNGLQPAWDKREALLF